MSKENVEVVLKWLDAFEHGRDALRELAHPEIEWAPFEESHTPSHGIEAAMQLRDQWMEIWGEHQIEVEEVWDGGDDVVVAHHVTARGRASGVDVDVRLYGHFRVREAKIVYVFEYQDRGEALEAAGLKH
jgi:ketosteroid isomerase-like protein